MGEYKVERTPEQEAEMVANVADEAAEREHKEEVVADIQKIMDDGKMEDIVVCRCRDGYFTEYVIIGTATSDRHCFGVATKVIQYIKQELDFVPQVDKKQHNWVVTDIGYAMIHCVTAERRENYQFDDFIKGIDSKSQLAGAKSDSK